MSFTLSSGQNLSGTSLTKTLASTAIIKGLLMTPLKELASKFSADIYVTLLNMYHSGFLAQYLGDGVTHFPFIVQRVVGNRKLEFMAVPTVMDSVLDSFTVKESSSSGMNMKVAITLKEFSPPPTITVRPTSRSVLSGIF